MANAGYPDNDGTRTPGGKHDLGRQRVSDCDVKAGFGPTSVQRVIHERGDAINDPTDSAGHATTYGWSHVDGDSNEHDGFVAGAYPASSGSDGTG